MFLYIFPGQKPVSKDEFSDILGAQGFKPPTEKEKETLKQLKKTEMAEIDDPIQRKVCCYISYFTFNLSTASLSWL